MRAEALSLSSLYSTVNKAYVVPDYQRPFAWDQERATDLLCAILEDAVDKQEITSIGTFLFCVVPTQQRHPFGNNTASSKAPNVVWEVVDGQQRLTVLALLGHALKLRYTALGRGGLMYSPPLEFDMMYSSFKLVHGTRVPMLIRDGDNFDGQVRSELGETLGAFINGGPRPHGTIADVFESVRQWTEANLDATNFGLFCDYLLGSCKYVQVVADSPDVAFTMFEPLNSTSEPLTAFEVYRSKAIRALGPAKSAFDHTLRYLNYTNSRRDDVVKRSNQLIFAMAQSYSGERPRVQFVRLKKFLDKRVNDRFAENLESGAEFLEGVWNDQNLTAPWFDEPTKDRLRFLRASGHAAPMPILMRFYQSDPGSMPETTKAIAAFWALWRAAFPTNKLPEVYRALLEVGSAHDMSIESGRLKSISELKVYLRAELERKIGQPNAALAKAAWISKAATTLNYEEHKAICRFFIFMEIGASLKQNLVPDDPWTNLDDIEHVLPAGTSPPPAELHWVGNLTFLPSEVNRSLKAIDWVRKREAYRWLASSHRPVGVSSVFSDGTSVPPGLSRYLGDPSSSALAHLDLIAVNPTWDAGEILKRTHSILEVVWRSLFDDWLH
jgi:hypothetical protein